MRVLCAAYGGYGHVLPVVGVACAFMDAGHEVVLATSAELGELAAARGVPAAQAGLNDAACIAEARRRWPETATAPPAAWTGRMFCEIAAPAVAADLGPLIAQFQPDVVLREEGEYGAPVAAAAAGVPWATIGWGSPLRHPTELALLAALVAPLWEGVGLRPPSPAELYGAAVLDPCPPSLRTVRDIGATRHVIRPVAFDTAHRGATAGVGRRSAYLGFGTVPLFRDSPGVIRAATCALVEHGFDVIVTTSDEALAAELARIAPDRVRARAWVDLPSVLASCDLAVCHGGAGTVLAALAAAVPLVLLPQGAPSQDRMAAACSARGVARVVDRTAQNAGGVASAVADVAGDEGYREAAGSLAAEIASMPDPAVAAAALAEAVRG